MGEQIVESALEAGVDDLGEHVAEVVERGHVVEPAVGEDREQRGQALAAFVGAGEEGVFASEGGFPLVAWGRG